MILVNHGQVVGMAPRGGFEGDLAYLEENRLVPTSLLKTNLELYATPGRSSVPKTYAHLFAEPV